MYVNSHLKIESTSNAAVHDISACNSSAIPILVLLFGLTLSSSQVLAATDAEKQCFDYVQDKIKWNYDHDARWKPENVEQLCKGTTQFKQPGECFNEVMHGGPLGGEGINWGGGTKWQWKNAVALCAGTDSADNRINCFKSRIGDNVKWDTAIAQCVTLTNAR